MKNIWHPVEWRNRCLYKPQSQKYIHDIFPKQLGNLLTHLVENTDENRSRLICRLNFEHRKWKTLQYSRHNYRQLSYNITQYNSAVLSCFSGFWWFVTLCVEKGSVSFQRLLDLSQKIIIFFNTYITFSFPCLISIAASNKINWKYVIFKIKRKKRGGRES